MNSAATTNIPKVAVIGSGYWGKNLVRNFHELGALELIVDKDETVLATIQGNYPDVKTCLALHEVLSRDDIDGVVVATSAESHYDLAREVILSGKHVFVEKPLALNEDDAEELVKLAGKGGNALMVGHLLQYHPVFVRLKELAASGELGRINYIYSHRLNLGKIRREENILWSFAPHDISMILALADEQPEEVIATGGNYLHQKIADVTTTHLEFSSGLRAHVFVSWLHPFKEQKLVVVGDRKMAVFDDTRAWQDKLLLYPHAIEWHSNVPVPTKADPERQDIPEAEPLKMECAHFLSCISKGKEPLTNGLEGLRVLRVLKAGQRSLDHGGAKIRLTGKSAGLSGVDSPEKEAGFDKYATRFPGCFVHETAVIDEDITLGSGTKIWHFSHVLSGSKVGQQCNIGQNVVIGPKVTIGNQCKIQNNVSIYPGVTLEDGVFCSPSMVFTNVYNPRAEIRKMDQARPTLVRQGATIGANATIICGNTIGKYAFIGAGAVVTKNVADFALVVGNPAKRIGWVCRCGERLSDDLECMSCEKKYFPEGEGIREA